MITIIYEYLKLSSLSHTLWTLLQSFFLLGLIFVSCKVLQKFRWRAKYNAIFPGLKVRFTDVIGLRSIYLNEKCRSGQSFQAALLQVILGVAKLYEDQKLVCLWLIFHPFVIPLKGEAVEVILKDPATLNKNFMYRHLLPLLGDGLITSSGDKWKCRRKMLKPCFHWEILKEYLHIFNQQASKLVKNLQKGTDSEIRQLNKPLFLCTLDIACETTMGVKIETQDNKNAQYVDALQMFCDQIHNLMSVVTLGRPYPDILSMDSVSWNRFHKLHTPLDFSIKKVVMVRAVTWWMWPDFIFRHTESSRILKDSTKITEDFTNEILRQKKKQYMSRRQEAMKRKSLLELLLKHHIDHQSISDEDVKEELTTFLVAATDTTSAAIAHTLYFLGQYKDIHENAQREVDDIFGDDKERPVEKEDISEMKYIECVIKESMRILPPVPLVTRVVSKDISMCGYNIPKGSSCLICAYSLHRDPETFPNPEIFEPTRFFPENSVKRHPFSYIPFSIGPRNCLGQKYTMMVIKTIVSSILRHFIVESLDPRDALGLSCEVTLKTDSPLNFRLKRRF